MDRISLLRSKYYLKPIVDHLVSKGKSQNEIADILCCTRSTVRSALRGELPICDNNFDELFGKEIRKNVSYAAEYDCIKFFVARGWQAIRTTGDSNYDVLTVKNAEHFKIQVKTSEKLSGRGWPTFKCYKTEGFSRDINRVPYSIGDFDYWYLYAINGDRWIIPFKEIITETMISMEGFDQYYIGRDTSRFEDEECNLVG